MMKMFSESLTNKLCIVLGTGLVLILASRVDNYHYDALSRKGFFQKDFLYRSLGEARRLFSQYSFMTADIYLHGGFYPDDYDIVHKGTSPMHEQNGAGHEKHEHIEGHEVFGHHEHEHDEDAEGAGPAGGRKVEEVAGIPKWNILPYIGDALHISRHIHLHGEEEKEVLPWLYYAVRLDPHNVTAYSIGGYWLGRRLGKVDEAIKLLAEGIRNNPYAMDLYYDIGRLYFFEKKDTARALIFFKKALRLLESGEYDRFDKNKVYLALSACYKNTDEPAKAAGYRAKVRLAPEPGEK